MVQTRSSSKGDSYVFDVHVKPAVIDEPSEGVVYAAPAQWGNGLFAACHVEAGTVLTEYEGNVVWCDGYKGRRSHIKRLPDSQWGLDGLRRAQEVADALDAMPETETKRYVAPGLGVMCNAALVRDEANAEFVFVGEQGRVRCYVRATRALSAGDEVLLYYIPHE